VELVDSHCHLDDTQFDADRTAVIKRARDAGVKYILSIGTGDGPPDLLAAIRQAEEHDFVYATVGVHPNDTPKISGQTFKDLERLLTHPKVRAVGEIGLDYHWSVPKDSQLPAFIQQLEIAAAARMPVVIHTRDAWADTLAVLRAHWAPKGLPGIMHCYSGDSAQARECLDMGFYLAFGGVSTFPKAAEVREAARITPGDKLLLETDAPYLSPIPFRGKRNEPAYVAHTARALAEARGEDLARLAAITTFNFVRLFGITSYTEDSVGTYVL
jgi:TatD DNase family protein